MDGVNLPEVGHEHYGSNLDISSNRKERLICSHNPTHDNQTSEIVPQCPKWRIERTTSSNTTPVQTKVEHTRTIITTTHRPHPPRFIVDQAKCRNTGQCREQEHREELVDKCSDEYQEEDSESFSNDLALRGRAPSRSFGSWVEGCE